MAAKRRKLAAARELAGLTQKALADKMGVHRLVVVAVEMGRRNPSVPTMAKWIRALGPYGSLDLFGLERIEKYRQLIELLGEQKPAAA